VRDAGGGRRAPNALLAPIADAGLLGRITHALLGSVDWTVNVAGDFVLNLLGGLIRDLIPRSWIHEGLRIMGWLVAVPDYSSRVAAPGGGHRYGFVGVNAMRGLYTWLGMAIAPLTLLYATSRAWSGQGDPPQVPLSRVLIVGIALLNYTWLWSQAVALSNQITHAILGVSAVSSGVQKMFEVLIAGVALHGLPLIGLLVMGAGGLQLIRMIFVKVALILVGALVFAIGPLMIGLVASDRGNAFARAWMTLALGLFVLPVLWASIFALAAVLISDATGGASVIGGDPGIWQVLGGLLIAMAAIAAFWLNIKLTKAFTSLAGAQLAGLLALAASGARALLSGASRAGSGAAGAAVASGGGAASLRAFASKGGGAVAGAGGALMPAGAAGAALAGAGKLARGGLIGAGGALAAKGVAGVASSGVARAAATSRAGSVATRAARGARTGWQAATRATDARAPKRPPARPPVTPPMPPVDAPPADAPSTHGAPAAAPSLPPDADSRQGRPGGRVRQAAALASARPPGATATRAPAGTVSREPAAADSPGAGDAANDAARAAFGQPPTKRPTPSLRHPFKGRRS
jgi:hypothetical protein